MNGLLFYPVQYEGEELSKNVFYTGAAPNQQAIPAVDYLMSKDGGAAKRWVLLGTDYVYPRTTNKILRAYLKSKGVKESDIDEKYTLPLIGHCSLRKRSNFWVKTKFLSFLVAGRLFHANPYCQLWKK